MAGGTNIKENLPQCTFERVTAEKRKEKKIYQYIYKDHLT